MRSFFGVEGEPGPEVIARASLAKLVIWEGLGRAIARGAAVDQAAVLVDETYGAEAIAAAKQARVRVAVPVEASGRDELEYEYRDWQARLNRLDPTWAKVLIRYNPDRDARANQSQRSKLRELTQRCRDADRALMLELLVPPEPAQLEMVEGDRARYDRELRPGLMVRAIEQIRRDEVVPHVWKIEGLEEPDECRNVASAAGAPCVVLGRGADRDAVDRWLRAAGGVSGYVGFAIGRSIWWDALKAFFASEAGGEARTLAADAIAGEYLRYVEVAEAAR